VTQSKQSFDGDNGSAPSDRGNDAARAGESSWFRTHGRDLKFLLVFGLLMGVYFVVATSKRVEEQFFPWYLQGNAALSGWVVHRFGYEDMEVRDRALVCDRGSISVERGCDAAAPVALFVSAVLASPAPILSRLSAAAVGTLLLLAINQIRIITLFLTNIHWKKAFDIMHLDVWQAAFILVAMLFWAVWAASVTRRMARRTDARA